MIVHGMCSCAFLLMICATCSAAEVERLSDLQDRFIDVEQGWGELGIDTAAHAAGSQPLPLQIGDSKYTSGLGHHANGVIEMALDGEYSHFDAEVGVQPLQQNQGSVVFQVFVDGQKQFDSGAMRGGAPAKTVSLALKGAQVLRLVATDGGDGITCDCANWADARLTRVPGAIRRTPERYNIAPFAQLVTSDPKRNDGARAPRTQEYHADDIYLEWPIDSLAADVSCVGLNWLAPRPIREIGITFKSDAPPANGAVAQVWAGPTAFQGEWKPLPSTIEVSGRTWRIAIDAPSAFQKLRWILPKSAAALRIDHLTAMTLTQMATADFVIETESGLPSPQSIGIYNGDFLNVSPSKLSLRYAQNRRWKSERTLLQFRMPEGRGFSVAIDDVLKRGPILVRDHGVFIAAASSDVTLAEYRKRIAARRTMLDQVRGMPDQTLAQAMAKVHHAVQDQSPVMLSLSCDNFKVIVGRDGTIDIPLHPLKQDDVGLNPPKNVARVGVKFGSGSNANLSRHLEGGWLPAPVVAVEENGASYQQRTMVIPTAAGAIAISEFDLDSSNQPAVLSLSFADATLRQTSHGTIVEAAGRVFAVIETKGAAIKTVEHGVEISAARGSARLLLPAWEAKAEEIAGKYADPISDLRSYWEKILGHASHIEVPDELLMNVIRASQVHCLMAARNEANGMLIAPWISSISYGPLESEANAIIRGMDLLGHDEFARRSLDYFISKYDPSGMLTTGYTLMGTGWHLQTLGQHYQLWRDQGWMKRVASKVATACAWIDRQRRKSLEGPGDVSKAPQYGLAPPGVMADWNNYAYYFCLNGYYCAGLREAATALNDVGFDGAKLFLDASADYAKQIRRAYHATQALMPVYPLRDGTWVPGYPSQVGTPGPTNDFFPGQDGNRSWCYDIELGAHQLVPQGVLEPTSQDVDWIMDHMEDVQFLASGWFDFPAAENETDPFTYGGFAKVQPYYCRNGEIYALRDDVKPFVRSYFNTLPTLLNTEVLNLQEHFHGMGAWNKTHETGYFLQQTRSMLVMERGDALWLAPFVTSNWLKDGMSIEVKNAPTEFGAVSYRIVSSADKGTIEATIDPPTRNALKQLVIRLRDPNGRKIKSVTLNGQPHTDFDASADTIKVAQPKGALIVRARYE